MKRVNKKSNISTNKVDEDVYELLDKVSDYFDKEDVFTDICYQFLSDIKDKKFFRCVSFDLIRAGRDSLRRRDTEYNKPIYVLGWLRYFVDYERYGNQIYAFMSNFIYRNYINGTRCHIITDNNLECLVSQYQNIAYKIDYGGLLKISNKDKDLIKELCKLLLTYVYMNIEYAEMNFNIIEDSMDTLLEDELYDQMIMNGVDEETASNHPEIWIESCIYFIKKAVEKNQYRRLKKNI